MSILLAQIRAIVWKDLMLERRTKQSISAMLVFSVAAVITFNFALDVNLSAARDVSLGLLWVIIWLAGTLGLNRSFSAETHSQALDALLIAPMQRHALYFGKLISLTITLLITEAILLLLFVLFFNRPFYHPAILIFLILGTIGYEAAGVFVGSMAVQTRSSYLLIPILMLPLTLPLIWAAAVGSAEFLLPQPDWSNAQIPLILVLLYNLLMLFSGYVAYNYVVEE